MCYCQDEFYVLPLGDSADYWCTGTTKFGHSTSEQKLVLIVAGTE